MRKRGRCHMKLNTKELRRLRRADLAIIGLGLALAEERDGIRPLHEAASREHIFLNRANGVDAPLPQAAVGQPGIPTAQDDYNGFHGRGWNRRR